MRILYVALFAVVNAQYNCPPDQYVGPDSCGICDLGCVDRSVSVDCGNALRHPTDDVCADECPHPKVPNSDFTECICTGRYIQSLADCPEGLSCPLDGECYSLLIDCEGSWGECVDNKQIYTITQEAAGGTECEFSNNAEENCDTDLMDSALDYASLKTKINANNKNAKKNGKSIFQRALENSFDFEIVKLFSKARSKDQGTISFLKNDVKSKSGWERTKRVKSLKMLMPRKSRLKQKLYSVTGSTKSEKITNIKSQVAETHDTIPELVDAKLIVDVLYSNPTNTYEICENDVARVNFVGSHNIVEVDESQYDLYAAPVGTELHGFEDGVNKIIYGLDAKVGQTRYFKCGAHPLSRFKITCSSNSRRRRLLQSNEEADVTVNSETCDPSVCEETICDGYEVDGECIAYTECLVDEYETVAPNGNTDRQCSPCYVDGSLIEGVWQDAAEGGQCKPHSTCPVGEGMVTMPSSTSDTVCEPCNEGDKYGFYSAVDDLSACLVKSHISCPVGQGLYKNNDLASEDDWECKACNDDSLGTLNMFNDEEGSTAECKPHKVWGDCTNVNEGECVTLGCTAGQRLEPGDANTDASCVDCHLGEASAVDAQTCTACTGDQHVSGDKTSCLDDTSCGDNQYKILGTDPATNDASCEPCDAGTFNVGPHDETSCQTCDSGSYLDGTSCTECTPGTYDHDSSSATACEPCPDGHFCYGGTHSEVCQTCSGGTYKTSDCTSQVNTGCRTCPFGFACDGSETTVECQNGQETQRDGAHAATGAAVCHTCTAGYKEVNHKCEPCPSGTFQNVAGQQSCFPMTTCTADQASSNHENTSGGGSSEDRLCDMCVISGQSVEHGSYVSSSNVQGTSTGTNVDQQCIDHFRIDVQAKCKTTNSRDSDGTYRQADAVLVAGTCIDITECTHVNMTVETATGTSVVVQSETCNAGVCEELTGNPDYTCNCYPGYSGEKCDVPDDNTLDFIFDGQSIKLSSWDSELKKRINGKENSEIQLCSNNDYYFYQQDASYAILITKDGASNAPAIADWNPDAGAPVAGDDGTPPPPPPTESLQQLVYVNPSTNKNIQHCNGYGGPISFDSSIDVDNLCTGKDQSSCDGDCIWDSTHNECFIRSWYVEVNPTPPTAQECYEACVQLNVFENYVGPSKVNSILYKGPDNGNRCICQRITAEVCSDPRYTTLEYGYDVWVLQTIEQQPSSGGAGGVAGTIGQPCRQGGICDEGSCLPGANICLDSRRRLFGKRKRLASTFTSLLIDTTQYGYKPHLVNLNVGTYTYIASERVAKQLIVDEKQSYVNGNQSTYDSAEAVVNAKQAIFDPLDAALTAATTTKLQKESTKVSAQELKNQKDLNKESASTEFNAKQSAKQTAEQELLDATDGATIANDELTAAMDAASIASEELKAAESAASVASGELTTAGNDLSNAESELDAAIQDVSVKLALKEEKQTNHDTLNTAESLNELNVAISNLESAESVKTQKENAFKAANTTKTEKEQAKLAADALVVSKQGIKSAADADVGSKKSKKDVADALVVTKQTANQTAESEFNQASTALSTAVSEQEQASNALEIAVSELRDAESAFNNATQALVVPTNELNSAKSARDVALGDLTSAQGELSTATSNRNAIPAGSGKIVVENCAEVEAAEAKLNKNSEELLADISSMSAKTLNMLDNKGQTLAHKVAKNIKNVRDLKSTLAVLKSRGADLSKKDRQGKGVIEMAARELLNNAPESEKESIRTVLKATAREVCKFKSVKSAADKPSGLTDTEWEEYECGLLDKSPVYCQVRGNSRRRRLLQSGDMDIYDEETGECNGFDDGNGCTAFSLCADHQYLAVMGNSTSDNDCQDKAYCPAGQGVKEEAFDAVSTDDNGQNTQCEACVNSYSDTNMNTKLSVKASCTSDADCPSRISCVNNECALKADNENCDADNQCESTHCDSFKCKPLLESGCKSAYVCNENEDEISPLTDSSNRQCQCKWGYGRKLEDYDSEIVGWLGLTSENVHNQENGVCYNCTAEGLTHGRCACHDNMYSADGTCHQCSGTSTSVRTPSYPDPLTDGDTRHECVCSNGFRVTVIDDVNTCVPCPDLYTSEESSVYVENACIWNENLCKFNQHVKFGLCVDCPPGLKNKRGDDPTGPDTQCDDPHLCSTNEQVVFINGMFVCLPCAFGTFTHGGDDPTNSVATTCCPFNTYETVAADAYTNLDGDLVTIDRQCETCGEKGVKAKDRYKELQCCLNTDMDECKKLKLDIDLHCEKDDTC